MISVLFDGATSLSTSAFEVDDLQSGSKVTCTLLGDKSVRCLGSGVRGSLGRFNGNPVTSIREIKQVSLGKGYTCLIAGEDSRILCFGSNDKGQLGNPNYGSSVDPVPVLDAENGMKAITGAKQITAGENHACALLKNGRALCWGDNLYGQAGNPSTQGLGVRTVFEGEKQLKPFQGIKKIVAGVNATCVIAKEDDSLFCFGDEYASEKKLNWSPRKIDIAGSFGTLSHVKQVGLGNGFGCALSQSSQVFCWGRNNFNQLGALISQPGLTKATQVKVTFPQERALSKIDELAVGYAHACAIHRDEKTVFCWGDNRYGQLGNTSVRGLPEQVALGSNNLTLKGVKGIAVGKDRTCITSSRDELFCWGNGAHGLLGSEKVASPYPVRVLDGNGEVLGGINQIGVGDDHSCVVDTNQNLYCFGINEFGQLGSQLVSGQVLNRDLTPVKNVTALSTSGLRTCLVHGDRQTVSCFGDRDIDNVNKRHDYNSFSPEPLRVGLSSYENVLGLSVGKNHVCVITADQRIECVGEGSEGQLGAGEVQSAKSGMVQSESKQLVKDIWQLKSSLNWNCALQQEKGSVWCWGERRGDRWLYAKPIPINQKESSDFIQISLSQDQLCGIRGIDRVVFCTDPDHKIERWNLIPQLDLGGRPLSKILSITGGDHHFCALSEKGQVYCWGSNEQGQLGLKTLKESQRPVPLRFKNDQLRRISRVSAGEAHTCLATSDQAALYCFGESFFGGKSSIEPVEYPL